MIRRQVAIFLVVGTLTVLVDFASYRLLIASGLLSIDAAKASGFVAGTVFAYVANRFWTFDAQAPASGTFWRFLVLYGSTLVANVAINAAALRALDSWPFRVQAAFVVATGVSATLNFAGMKWLVFRAPRHPESA